MDDDFTKELKTLINKYSKENGSNTPDYILARYLIQCLNVFNSAVNERAVWYGSNDAMDMFYKLNTEGDND